MLVERIFIGGWFQRTTLHLSEIYDFFRYGTSQLALDSRKLKKYQEELQLKKVEYQIDGMEYLRVTTENNLSIDIFEDGLIILSTNEEIEVNNENLADKLKFLADYYEQKFSPALTYLFSLGSPVPKELANIKTVYPYFFVFNYAAKESIQEFLELVESEKYMEVSNKEYDLFRGDRLYIVNRKNVSLEKTKSFIEEQIFLREFKGQLHRYLNIHRIIWEKIDKLRAQKKVKGREVEKIRSQIESYAKTINLIEARINQMGTYLETREGLVHCDADLELFMPALEYRYEALINTLYYSQYLWEMTRNHVNSALVFLTSLEQEVTNTSIENLTMITAVGVGASLIGLLTTTEMPQFTVFGIIYFVVLMIVGYVVKVLINAYNRHHSYDYTEVDYDTKIK